MHLAPWMSLPVIASLACASRPAARPAQGAPAETTIVRTASFEDPELESRRLGRLEIVVRSADRPTQALEGALVSVSSTPRDSLRRMTNVAGLAQFDSIPVGTYQVLVRRIGYATARGSVDVKPGCRTDVEAYVGLMAVGLDPPPPMPGRIAVTTCP